MSGMTGFSHVYGGRLPDGARVAIATARGRPYYCFSTLLKGLSVGFESILPGEIPAYAGHLVLTTASEYPRGGCHTPALFFEDVVGCIPAVACGMMIRQAGLGSGPADELVIGIDPGQRSGLSISYCGQEIESSTHPSVEGLVTRVVQVLGGLYARRRLIKIGDGDMDTADMIVEKLALRFCSSFEIELVDESRTSPRFRNFNRRGRRDILSARHISRRDGQRRHRDITPFSITG